MLEKIIVRKILAEVDYEQEEYYVSTEWGFIIS